MNNFRHDPQKLDVASAANRRKYVGMSETWTRQQVARLGVTEADLLTAIRERGWLAEDIEKLPASQAGYLARSPIIPTLAAAPIMPIVRDTESMERRRVRQVTGTLNGKAA